MISQERIQEILKNKGIDLESIIKHPQLLEKACNAAYKAIPIPMRWFVGRKRVKGIVVSLTDNISAKIKKKHESLL